MESSPQGKDQRTTDLEAAQKVSETLPACNLILKTVQDNYQNGIIALYTAATEWKSFMSTIEYIYYTKSSVVFYLSGSDFHSWDYSMPKTSSTLWVGVTE